MKITYMIDYNQETKLWIAMSLEFGLAAQADTEHEVKQKIKAQIKEYIDEAIGQDRAFQAQLLSRKAPISYYMKYYWIKFKSFFKGNGDSSIFSQSTIIPHT